MIKKLLIKTWSWAKPYFTWKMMPFLLVAWLITNGWSYLFIVIGQRFGITWMTVAGSTWVALLWMPFTIEKPVTIAIAGFLYKMVYRENFKKDGEKDGRDDD